MGGLTAGAAGAANLGIAGAAGMGGGAIAGSGGIAGGGNADAAGALAGAFCDPAEALGGLREMICVYGLGPLATTGSLGTGTPGEGGKKAPVAPSGADATGMTAGGFGGTGIGGGSVENTGIAGATGGAGGGATLDSLRGAGGIAGASLMARGSPEDAGGAAAAGFRERISESANIPVNPELDPEPAT